MREEHSRAPWKKDIVPQDASRQLIHDADGCIVCSVSSPFILEGRANANVIEAAPELLERAVNGLDSLLKLHALIDGMPQYSSLEIMKEASERISGLRMAIRQARGQ
jgi:hypothetical protein